MVSIRFHLLVLAVTCVSTSAERLSLFDTAGIVVAHGYPAETHHVTTSDGYILKMHRIPYGKEQAASANRSVVFLMHGLTAASNFFIMLGPEFAPAYNLADAGFDIWMGNARGNRNSRFHVSLNPDDPVEKFDFFDFTFEEIATRDLPAMIDYILQHTGQKKLHYIGHSQGGTTFLVLNSMLPEYNDKIQSAHLLAPIGYQDYYPDPQLTFAAQLTDIIYVIAVQNGSVELFPPETDAGTVGESFSHCTGDESTAYMCELIRIKYLTRFATNMNTSVEGIFDDYVSAGAALKQLTHFGQNVRDKLFRRWSYGVIQNVNIYGTSQPPAYNLSLITVNTTMHYTVSDDVLDERDVLAMADDMPNASVRKVARKTFLHDDFMLATDAKQLVTDYIIETLRRDSGLSENENDEEEDSDEVMPGSSATHLVINHIFIMYLILITCSCLLK